MNDKYQIPTASQMEHRATLAALLSLGFTYQKKSNLDEVWKELKEFPVIVVYTGYKDLGGNFTVKEDKVCGAQISLSNYIQLFCKEHEPKVVKVWLNEEYTAEVSKHGIKVGCTIIPLQRVEKLAEAVKKVEQDS